MSQNGFILWALSEHYKLSHDDAWLKRAAPQMIKGCNWFVRERARTKVLENGQTIEVKRTPSYFGEVNYIARSSLASGKISVEIEPTAWQKSNVVLHVRPPSAMGKIKSVTVNGQDWKEFDGESVKLPKLDEKTVVVCSF